MATNKGFIKDWLGNHILPITRGELVLDQDGNVALNSEYFLAGANGNGLPGLITAAERAMLTGGGQGGGISDIYAKLEIINNGFKVNGAPLNFYNAEGVATPINFISADNTISIIAGLNNAVNFSLAEVPNAETTVTQILKGITVDKYGRVTSVTSAALTNADIPEELEGKKLKDGVLENAKTFESEVGSDPTSVVNKAYVDNEIAKATGVAKGALKFGGAINDADTATGYLSNLDNCNSYYKVTADLTLAKSDFYETSSLNATGDTVKVKTGDTLIIYKPTPNALRAQFIYIPSGDELTAVTIRKETTDGAVDVLRVDKGNIILRFSDIFNITNTSGTQVASISIPKASSTNSGYLSSTDYAKFSSYESTLSSLSYVGEIAEGSLGSYKIGTLTIGTNNYSIIGKYSISTLTLNNNGDSEYNPIMKFTSTGSNDVDITFKGAAGIKVKKNGTNIEFGAANEIIEQDVPQEKNPRKVKYLTINNGYQFGVQIGKADIYGNVEQDGLTDFSQFNALVNKISRTIVFETIDYSLKGEASETEYRYGNDVLLKAIGGTRADGSANWDILTI
jgi:hypothetical protein